MVVEAVNTWSFLVAIIGLGIRFLTRSESFLTYANEAVLPFYILHQTVIISVGYFVIPTNVGVGIKYLTISASSFLIIMALYELVRRINVLRLLFGMRAIRRSSSQAVPTGNS